MRPDVRPALEVFLLSRLGLWLAAAFAFLWFEPKPPPLAAAWDSPWLHDAGWLVDLWARWDSAWFVRIAAEGYGTAPEAPAFFPLYPGVLAVVGRALGGHYVVAGVLVSLVAGAAAFVLLHRLARERLGEDGAWRAVLYLAVFPTSLFLGAVYGESLFLLLAVGAFVAAERERWPLAGALAGLALLTRPTGAALLPALALLAWRSPARPRALAWLGLAPLLFLAYPLVLWRQVGDPWAFVGAQDAWTRRLTWLGPLQGVWDGARAALAGGRQLWAGPEGRIYWDVGAEPLHAAAVNLQGFAFLLVFAALAWLTFRRLGAAYGLYAAVGLAIPLALPSERWPLLSLPRFGLVLFPLFLALALLGERPGRHAAILGSSALLLGITAVQWVLYQWTA